jgi:hypothetical protein
MGTQSQIMKWNSIWLIVSSTQSTMLEPVLLLCGSFDLLALLTKARILYLDSVIEYKGSSLRAFGP